MEGGIEHRRHTLTGHLGSTSESRKLRRTTENFTQRVRKEERKYGAGCRAQEARSKRKRGRQPWGVP